MKERALWFADLICAWLLMFTGSDMAAHQPVVLLSSEVLSEPTMVTNSFHAMICQSLTFLSSPASLCCKAKLYNSTHPHCIHKSVWN